VNVISIGEVLWDVMGPSEHLGGAPFNFAAHLGKLGHAVSFVSAVGRDERGRRILDCVSAMGLSTRYLGQREDYPTGVVTVSFDRARQPHYLIHRPVAYDFPQLSDAQLEELFSRPVDWIYFGTLQQSSPEAKRLTRRLLDSGPGARRFYDVNLRVDGYEPALVRELMSLATVVKLNDEEVLEVTRMFGQETASLEQFCRSYSETFGWTGACVTRGAKGCVLLIEGEYVEAPGYPVAVADSVGAGDAFAAAFLHGLGAGWPVSAIADFANRVAALVAARPGAIPPWSLAEAEALGRNRDRLESA
jgi:fructokinase